ncbi:FAD-binding oxidoreductase, partial [Candidatus Parcubacteria bacterium]|nr:FAD-binding oxidoreductase [Candidatus Parcubacteria bacterium]
MKHEIFWKNPSYQPRPALSGDIECDYLIVGGGITGVSAAYFLAKSGEKNIVLIDKNQIASGATGMAAGSLVLQGETDLLDLFKTHSPEEAVLYWEGIHQGLDSIQEVIKTEHIDCDAEPQDTFYGGYRYTSLIDLDKEYEAQKSLEPTTRYLTGEELRKELNTPLFTRAILSSFHGLSVNPLKLTQNLSNALVKYGVSIYENTAYLGSTNSVAKTGQGSIRYKKMIVGIDADDPTDEVKTQKTTIGITRPLTEAELEETGLKKKKIVWDTKKSYHYFKLTKDNRLLIGFGTTIVHKKHRKTQPHLPHFNQIESFSKKLFPYLNLPFEYAWTGNFGVTKNYEPHIVFEDNSVSISGAGSQVICFMAAHHVVNKLLGKPSDMDISFPP